MIVTVVVPAAAAAAVGPYTLAPYTLAPYTLAPYTLAPYTLAPYTLAPYTLALPAGPGGVGALNLTNPELVLYTQCVYSSGAHCISRRMMRMCAFECVDLALNCWPGALNLTNPELDLVLNSWPGAGEGLGS
jgi:hypothetical protein